ncbi:MAG: hypothetical protein ABF990_12440 [Acetobacter sp.]|uniref:hypothetical protein n=1 Tax=Acetobacter sp. TaxID=440 RepID=UPI0039ED2B58
MAWKQASFITLWLIALSLALCSTFIFIACGLKFSVFHSGLNVGHQEFSDSTELSLYLWQFLPESGRWNDYVFSLPGMVGLSAFLTSIALGSFAALRLEELNHHRDHDRQADMHRWDALLVGQHDALTERA